MLPSPPLLHGHPSACDAIHGNGTTERQKPDWADTYIDIDLPGGPDRRELHEIVNWEISASAAETIKKKFRYPKFDFRRPYKRTPRERSLFGGHSLLRRFQCERQD